MTAAQDESARAEARGSTDFPSITVHHAQLRELMTKAVVFVARRSPLPITAGLLIAAENGWFSIAATDLEVAGRALALVEGDLLPTVIRPADLKQALASISPRSRVTLTTDEDGRLCLQDGDASISLHGLDPTEFPAIRTPDLVGGLKLPAAVLAQMIAGTAFAAAKDDTRPVLGGVLLEWRQGTLTMTATDSHRLALMQRQIESDLPDFTVIVPATTLNRILKVLPKTGNILLAPPREGTYALHLGWAGFELTARHMEGTYPNFRQLIPTRFTVKAEMGLRDLQATVQRVMVGRDPASRIDLLVNGHVDVAVRDPERGEATARVQAESSGGPLSISFHAPYLAESLKVLVAVAPAAVAAPRRPAATITPPAPVMARKTTFQSDFAKAVFNRNRIRQRALQGNASQAEVEAAEAAVIAVRDARDRGEYAGGEVIVPATTPAPEMPPVVPSAARVVLGCTGATSAAALHLADDEGTVHVIMPLYVPKSR